jgi:hypothetical protein
MEWRIFFPVSQDVQNDIDSPLNFFKEVIGSNSKKKPEKRTDLYILFDSAFGLKIRNCHESSAQLEIKVRTSRSSSGIQIQISSSS